MPETEPLPPAVLTLPRPLKWTLTILAILAFLVGFNQVCTMVWYSPKIEARVASADGTPVAGAIVLVSWNIEGPWNGASLGQLALVETVTSKDGTFTIPAWGPRFHFRGGIPQDEPTVRIFSPGFAPLTLKNFDGVPMHGANPIIHFLWQNQTITLNRFKGTPGDYETSLLELEDDLRKVIWWNSAEACYWKQMPQLLLALGQEKTALAAQGAGNSLRATVQIVGTGRGQCGNASQFFQDFAAAQR